MAQALTATITIAAIWWHAVIGCCGHHEHAIACHHDHAQHCAETECSYTADSRSEGLVETQSHPLLEQLVDPPTANRIDAGPSFSTYLESPAPPLGNLRLHLALGVLTI